MVQILLTETSMARARVQTLLTLKSAKLEAEDIYRYFTCLKMPYSVNLKLYVVIYAAVFLKRHKYQDEYNKIQCVYTTGGGALG